MPAKLARIISSNGSGASCCQPLRSTRRALMSRWRSASTLLKALCASPREASISRTFIRFSVSWKWP
ncbi:hypothetical protein D9M71_106070 [compost metagenome]